MSQIDFMIEIDKSLKKIDDIFKIDNILNERITEDFIETYYKKYHEYSNRGYKIFYTPESYVHTALNFNGQFDEKGYYAQPKAIHDFIKQNKQIYDVIELGCGKGFNSTYLAELNHNVSFSGIDLTPEFVNYAHVKNKNPTNLSFKLGDYLNLPMKNNSYDLVFDVEAVCHAKDIKQVLTEVHKDRTMTI